MSSKMYDIVTNDKNVTTATCEFGASQLLMETGRMARQANSILAQVGGTVVMVNAVASEEPRPGMDFFPLMIDYREKFYAAGRIPGGFFKREARPSTRETLRARLIDRPLRPLFPDGYRNDIIIFINVISYDGVNPAELVAMNAASAALSISEMPFAGPIAGVRIGLVDDELILNPTCEESAASDLDLVVAGTEKAITMVECGADEVDEETMVEALEFAHEHIRVLCQMQTELAKKAGKAKAPFAAPVVDEDLKKKIFKAAGKPLAKAFKVHGKFEQEAAIKEAREEVFAGILNEGDEDYDAQKKAAKGYFKEAVKELLRERILKDGVRNDGRKTDEVRPITIETGVLPRTHGSALFTRGETQSLGILTLGTRDDEQMNDSITGLSYQRFYLHYNFPGFSVGEARPPRGTSRREIGHGALAERAILPMLPSPEDYPYTMRLVSEILESNGSSSMASVCSCTLALMDGGIKIKRPVSGIAMGLIMEGKSYAILSDISGTEDHLGDMDFKVTGTDEGITALQMDIKIEGITPAIMAEALEQAKAGRAHIMGKMLEALPEPRSEMSPYAPRIETLKINPDKIREIIGPGGKTINALQEETGTKISVEQDGTVAVSSPDGGAVMEAIRRIEAMTADAEVGKIYQGKVVNITNFGAFVEIFPGRDGLLHISEMENYRVAKVEDVLNLGDAVEVKCVGIDDNGRVRLSRKVLLPGYEEGADNGGGGRGGDRGGDRGGRGGDRGGRGGRDRGDREERGGRRRERPARNEDEDDRPRRRRDEDEEDDRPRRDRGGERGSRRNGDDDDRPRRRHDEDDERPARPARPARDEDEDDDVQPYRRGISRDEDEDSDDDRPAARVTREDDGDGGPRRRRRGGRRNGGGRRD